MSADIGILNTPEPNFLPSLTNTSTGRAFGSLVSAGKIPGNQYIRFEYQTYFATQLIINGLPVPELNLFPDSTFTGQRGRCIPPRENKDWQVVGITYEDAVNYFPIQWTNSASFRSKSPISFFRKPDFKRKGFEGNPSHADVRTIQLLVGVHELAHFVTMQKDTLDGITDSHLARYKKEGGDTYRCIKRHDLYFNIGERIADSTVALYANSNSSDGFQSALSVYEDCKLNWGWSRKHGRLMAPRLVISHNTHSTMKLTQEVFAKAPVRGMNIVECVDRATEIVTSQDEVVWDQAGLEILRETTMNPDRKCNPAIKPRVEEMRRARDLAHKRLTNYEPANDPREMGAFRRLAWHCVPTMFIPRPVS